MIHFLKVTLADQMSNKSVSHRCLKGWRLIQRRSGRPAREDGAEMLLPVVRDLEMDTHTHIRLGIRTGTRTHCCISILMKTAPLDHIILSMCVIN